MSALVAPLRAKYIITCPFCGLDHRMSVDNLVDDLAEPDRDMLEAGARELEHALPAGTTSGYRRRLAGVIWCAMLRAAG